LIFACCNTINAVLTVIAIVNEALIS